MGRKLHKKLEAMKPEIEALIAREGGYILVAGNVRAIASDDAVLDGDEWFARVALYLRTYRPELVFASEEEAAAAGYERGRRRNASPK